MRPMSKKDQRRRIRLAQRASDTPVLGINLNNINLARKLQQDATAKGVSLTAWVRAILYDFSGVRPGLTQQSAETIKETLRGDHHR
jgi:hypothetical protein